MSKMGEVRVAVDVRCEVGEGSIWHPERGTLIWFDIFGRTVFEASATGGAIHAIGFGEQVSAAGLIDASSIAVASASGLYRLNLDTRECSLMAPLEADNPATRSNDGRAGPGGSFWLGTVGCDLEEGAGALYRYSNGTFTQLRSGLTCLNCLSFSPDGTRAYFSETFAHQIFVYPLDPATGLPNAEPDLFLDLSEEGLNPDGAVLDMEGCLWTAEVRNGRVARYRPDGTFDRAIDLPVSEPTCPAFGGPDHKTLFITTAWTGLSKEERARQSLAGAVFSVEVDVPGLPERRVAV